MQRTPADVKLAEQNFEKPKNVLQDFPLVADTQVSSRTPSIDSTLSLSAVIEDAPIRQQKGPEGWPSGTRQRRPSKERMFGASGSGSVDTTVESIQELLTEIEGTESSEQ